MSSIPLQIHQCKECQKLSIDIRSRLKKSSPRDRRPHDRNYTFFSVNVQSVAQAATLGCDFCAWLLDLKWIARADFIDTAGLASTLEDQVASPGEFDGISYRFFLNYDVTLQMKRLTLRSLLEKHGNTKLENLLLAAKDYAYSSHPLDIFGFRCFILWDADTEVPAYRCIEGLSVFTSSDSLSSKYISTRPIEYCVESTTIDFLAKHWLAACVKHREAHQRCKSSTPTLNPTRLVEIVASDGNINLKLIRSNAVQPVPYAALSYCWGNDMQAKLLRRTLSQYCHSIPFEELSKTIQDALKVCIALGIQYLWVDALCIVQNDPVDKNYEVAQMIRVYRNATMTIIASSAHSAQDGFIDNPYSRKKGIPAYSIPFICPGDVRSSVLLADIRDEPEPLNTRAWALQERIFSSRILEFTTTQTRWICRGTLYDRITDGWRETPPPNLSKWDGINETLLYRLLDCFENAQDNTQPQIIFKGIEELWYRLVEAYTERSLTRGPDRILAIAGLAELFATVLKDEYYAGLWKSMMPLALLWRVQKGKQKSLPKEFRGPSWSWTAVDSPVICADTEDSPISVVEVVQCKISLVDARSPFGSVRERSCLLILRGKIALGILYNPYDKTTYDEQQSFPIVRLASKTQNGHHDPKPSTTIHILPDATNGLILTSAEGRYVQLLQVTVSGLKSGQHCEGLVLQRISPDRFVRIGLFYYDWSTSGDESDSDDEKTQSRVPTQCGEEPKFFRDCPVITITIAS